MAGGKQAAERRKLKRLKALQASGGEGATGASAEIEKINRIRSNDRNNAEQPPYGRNEQRRHSTGNPQGNNLKRHRLSDVSATKKKPKHLKRKLEQLTVAAEQDLEKAAELEKLKAEMNDLEQQKKKRNFVFETKIQAAAGEAFDKERFRALIEQGIAKEKIVDALQALYEEHGTANIELTGDVEGELNEPDVEGEVNEPDAEEEVNHRDAKEPAESKQDNTEITKDNEEVCKKVVAPVQEVSSSSDEDSDNSSDSEDEEEETNQRSRGRGNKNRKKEQQSMPKDQSTKKEDALDSKKVPVETKSPRRCLGRKPVTDFKMWESYDGKVVYLKPFGAFIDIGCHSDAFCHVSRTRDEFAQNINQVLKVGDAVKGRVTEIDRSKKRITLSLQSESMIDIEKKAYENHQKHLAENKPSKPAGQTQQSKPFALGAGTTSTTHKHSVNIPAVEESNSRNVLEIEDYLLDKSELKRKRKLERRAQRRMDQPEDAAASEEKEATPSTPISISRPTTASAPPMDDAAIAKAESKRKRKLERRAERREKAATE